MVCQNIQKKTRLAPVMLEEVQPTLANTSLRIIISTGFLPCLASLH